MTTEDTPLEVPTWADRATERAAERKREQALLLLVPRLVVLAAGPLLAQLVFTSVYRRDEMNTAGDLVGSLLSLGLGLIGATTTLVGVWAVGWLALRRV